VSPKQYGKCYFGVWMKIEITWTRGREVLDNVD